MVVLAVGIEGSKGANKLAETLQHLLRRLRVLHGIPLQAPPRGDQHRRRVPRGASPRARRNIPSSVAQGSGAAAKVIGLLSKPLLESDPQISVVDIKRCVGWRQVHQGVPVPGHRRKGNSRRKEGADHRGRGARAAAFARLPARRATIQLSHFTDNQSPCGGRRSMSVLTGKETPDRRLPLQLVLLWRRRHCRGRSFHPAYGPAYHPRPLFGPRQSPVPAESPAFRRRRGARVRLSPA